MRFLFFGSAIIVAALANVRAAAAAHMTVIAATVDGLQTVDLDTIKRFYDRRVSYWSVVVFARSTKIGIVFVDYILDYDVVDCGSDMFSQTYVAEYRINSNSPIVKGDAHDPPEIIIPGSIAEDYERLVCSSNASAKAISWAWTYNELARQYRFKLSKSSR